MENDIGGRIGHDIGDYADLIVRKAWANPASRDRAGALRAEPLRVSGKAAHRISQEQLRDGSASNKPLPRNS
jgi:hypothetical protein